MPLNTIRLTAVAAAAVAFLSAMQTDAHAQVTSATVADGGEQRMEITARKRSEPLQEVPVAAKTFSAEALADENVNDLKSLAARTASATTFDQGVSFASEVVLRGAGIGRAVNAETATGLYRNGAYASGGNIGGRSFNKMDFFDVQRVEVMRGPQGALFGRGAVGGAMNIINVRPQFTASRSATLTAGENQALGLEAIVNQPLSEQVALRVGVKSNSAKGGTVTDVASGAPLDAERFDGARVSLAYSGKQFSYQLMADGFSEAGPSFGVYQFLLAQPTTRFTRAFNTPARFGRNEWTVIGEGQWDLGAATVVALTQLKGRDAHTRDDFDRFNNIAATIANLQSWERFSEDNMRRFGQELRVQNANPGALQWLAGVEFLRLEDTFTVDLNGALARARPNNSINTTISNDTSVGWFGLLGYDLARQLNATLELRQQSDRKKFRIASTTNTFPTGTSVALQDTGPVTTTTLTQNFDRKFDGLAKVLALTYKHSRELNAYLRYGEAFRPGGYNNDPDRNTSSSTPPGPRFSIAYEQEHAKTTELGLKTEWFQRRLRMNVAAYRTTIDDILINANVSTTPPGSSTSRVIQYIENGGRSRLEGIELDLHLNLPAPGPSGQLIVDGALNLTDSLLTTGNFAGRDVPLVRPKAGTLGITYQMKPFGWQRVFVNLNAQHLRGGYQDAANAIAMDDADIVNLNLGARGANWLVTLNVSNVNNYLYITSYNNQQRLTGYTSAPRSWSLRAGVTF